MIVPSLGAESNIRVADCGITHLGFNTFFTIVPEAFRTSLSLFLILGIKSLLVNTFSSILIYLCKIFFKIFYLLYEEVSPSS